MPCWDLEAEKIDMWIWIIVIAVVIGGLIGFFSSNDSSEAGGNAIGGAMAGGCMAVGCLWRILLIGLGVIFVLWLFGLLFR